MKVGFKSDAIALPLDDILPSTTLKPGVKASGHYKQIEASVRVVGVIEPLVVCLVGKSDKYMLLDGHKRMEVLRDLGRTEAVCLVSTDDENCTYNLHVNHLNPIQAYRMIQKAIKDGAPEEEIARALNVAPKTIHKSLNKLTDIAPEVIEKLKDAPIGDAALRLLKKVKPYRQIEMADVMRLSNNYTANYAKTLLLTTAPDQLVAPLKDDRPAQMAQLETELRVIERDFTLAQESYSEDTLNLQLARSYLKLLLQNARVSRYLDQKRPDLHAELTRIVEVSSLE
jgi:ParB-like chromosome segregation protein Spo0J